MIKEAMLYEKLQDGNVRCNLCAHRCTIHPERQGVCGVRGNRDGVLYSMAYGTLIAQNVDPIEKNLSFMYTLPHGLTPLPRWAAIFSVTFVRITIFHKRPEKQK